jgi:hypothetical protein
MSLLTRGPLNKFIPITTSDTVDLVRYQQTQQLTDGIYVGGAGNLVAVMADNSTCVFTAPPVGTVLPIGVRRINATSTTATLLVALYQI